MEAQTNLPYWIFILRTPLSAPEGKTIVIKIFFWVSACFYTVLKLIITGIYLLWVEKLISLPLTKVEHHLLLFNRKDKSGYSVDNFEFVILDFLYLKNLVDIVLVNLSDYSVLFRVLIAWSVADSLLVSFIYEQKVMIALDMSEFYFRLQHYRL